MNLKIAIVANSIISARSMGGGDRIMVELAKSWQNLGAQMTLFGPPEAKVVCEMGGLKSSFIETSNLRVNSLGTVKTYILRILKAISDHRNFSSFDVIYSASESLPDVALSAKIKRQNPTAVWVVGFYLIAPNPLIGEVSFSVNNILQYIQQKISLVISKVSRVSAFFVLGRDDQKYLERWRFRNILRIDGGVDTGFINSIPDQEKIYDACFVGRISRQKGVDDLLKIWREVVNQKPTAQLAFIGWGHPGQQGIFLEEIKRAGLTKNINFIGFSDGEEKYKIIKSSKLLLFPSRYESFGIVVLESLAAGVPVVAYDLSILKENFKEGVSFVGAGRISDFARQVLFLFGRDADLPRMAERGRILAQSFDWRYVGKETFNYISGQRPPP